MKNQERYYKVVHCELSNKIVQIEPNLNKPHTKFIHKIFKEHFVTSEIGLLDVEEQSEEENMEE